MANKPAGGYGSKQIVTKPQPKREPLARAVDPSSVSYMGQSLAFRPGPLYTGTGLNSQKAGQANSMVVGVGGGRTVMKSGTQHTYGAPRQPEPDRAPDVPGAKPGRDILSQYGPESK